jgi:membrane protein implicated in regulation of membrane protease activity/RNA polymerase subunit RPABC4/transcription elongation factor Spt4
MIAPDTVIANRYRVIQPLGEGGMKAVYLAEDLRFKLRRCALAVMVDSFTSDDARRRAVGNFEREADVLAQLDHASIPKVSDRFSEQNRHYFVMDYVGGQTLEEKLSAVGGRLEQSEAINIALQICEALDYLHTRIPPVIYRDLKPSNIMVTAEGMIKLIDFGIARHFTRQGTTVGTVGYAAPEQYQGECDQRSDVYALGATLHQMLSGRDPARFPFDFPPLSTLLPGCDPNLDRLLGEALKREHTQRLASAREFARRLQLLPSPEHPQTNLPRPPPKPLARSFAGEGKGEGSVRAEGSDIEGAGSGFQAGMQNCPRCANQIPADARRCPSCGTRFAVFSPSSGAPLTTIGPALSVTVRLCPQCKREVPTDARVCPYCAGTLGAARSTARGWIISAFNRRPVLAVVLIIVVLAGGLFVRDFWGPATAVPWPIWILAGVMFLVLEVHYTRDFTLFCFGAGALIVGLLTALGVLDVWAQWISFAALSTALLFSAREWLRMKMFSKPAHAELENIIGQSAIPLDDLPAYGFGKAELRGTTWSAHNASHVRIVRGQRCKVMRMNGLTLWIMPE